MSTQIVRVSPKNSFRAAVIVAAAIERARQPDFDQFAAAHGIIGRSGRNAVERRVDRSHAVPGYTGFSKQLGQWLCGCGILKGLQGQRDGAEMGELGGGRELAKLRDDTRYTSLFPASP